MTAGYILVVHQGDRNLKAAGTVLLAVAVQLVWAPIVFQLFTPELLHADAALVGEILAWLLPDVVWRGTTFIAPDGHTLSSSAPALRSTTSPARYWRASR